VTSPPPIPTAAVDFDTTLVLALETSARNWVIAAQVPGLGQVKAKQVIGPDADQLAAAIEGYRRRAAKVGKAVERVVLIYEAGYGGFWLARWLTAKGIEVHVIQPSSVPVERKKRRAKSDRIDADLLLRTLLAWLRGEPRVCTMVPIPDEAVEDARRQVRERAELITERVALTNRIGAILATVGVGGYNPLRRDRRARLQALRTPLGQPLPDHAKAKIARALERLELVLAQIATLEEQRDAVLEEKAPDAAERMIQALVLLRGIGAQFATVLVWEAFVRHFPTAKALGSYAGLVGTPFSSGGTEREQGISKAGNRRLRATAVELAWMWRRHQPDSELTKWFEQRLAGAKGRMKKVLIIAASCSSRHQREGACTFGRSRRESGLRSRIGGPHGAALPAVGGGTHAQRRQDLAHVRTRRRERVPAAAMA